MMLAQAPFVSPWWIAWIAGGAAAAAIPVVLHMIHTARAPQVPFPTLRFLRSAAEKTARRRKIENILLMILRMLLFAILALALARPFLSETFGLFAGDERGAAVLVLDNSYSMAVRHEGTTRFAKAKAEARAILESRWRPQQAAVLLTNPGPDPVPQELYGDRARLFRDVDGAAVAPGRADLTGTLGAAYTLLDKTPAANKRLWVLTDRQALSWQGLTDVEAPGEHPDVPIAVIRATEPSLVNMGLTDARVASRSLVVGMPIRIDVTVRNAGPAPETRNLLLFVDDFGQARRKQPVDLAAAGAPGSTKVVPLVHVFERPGAHKVLVAIEGTDALGLDDTRRVALEIADRIPVLLVKEEAAAIPVEDPSFYLVRALDPAGDAPDVPWAIRPVETAADDLDPADLDRYDAVFLNDVAAPDEALARALAAYVESGRTLVVFLGPRADLNAYNRLLAAPTGPGRGLLPARLKERVGDAVLKNAPRKVTQVQGRSPWLEDLVESADIYHGILVYEHVRTEGAPADTVLARLDGGGPMLLAHAFGRGNVLMVTTTADTRWTNFPVRNLFLPLMMRIVHLAARGQADRRDILAGETFEIELDVAAAEPVSVEIAGPLGPGGETVTELTETIVEDGRHRLRFAKTSNLGYYTYRAPGRDEVSGLFATNHDGVESDLAEIADGTLRAELDARETHVAAAFADLVARFEETARRELWQYFLAACLLLAILEPLVANWMRPDRREAAHPTVRRTAA